MVQFGDQQTLVLLGYSTFGYVLYDSDEIIDRVVCLAHTADGNASPDNAAILAKTTLLEAVTFGFPGECLVQQREIGFKIVWVCEVLKSARGKLLDRIAEHPRQAVVG